MKKHWKEYVRCQEVAAFEAEVVFHKWICFQVQSIFQ